MLLTFFMLTHSCLPQKGFIVLVISLGTKLSLKQYVNEAECQNMNVITHSFSKVPHILAKKVSLVGIKSRCFLET